MTLAAATALAQTPPIPLRVSMLSLPVKEMERSVKFYGETLGLQLAGKPGEVTFYRAGDIMQGAVPAGNRPGRGRAWRFRNKRLFAHVDQ